MEQRRRPPTTYTGQHHNRKHQKRNFEQKGKGPWCIEKNNITYLDAHRQEGVRPQSKRPPEPFKLPKLPKGISIVVLVLLSICVLFMMVNVQHSGIRVAQAQEVLTAAQNENEVLKQKVAHLSSLSRVEEIAKNELGMEKAEGVLVYSPSEATLTAQKKLTEGDANAN